MTERTQRKLLLISAELEEVAAELPKNSELAKRLREFATYIDGQDLSKR